MSRQRIEKMVVGVCVLISILMSGTAFGGLYREIWDSVPNEKVREEGEPPCGIEDADKAYDCLAHVWDFYFDELGRDNYDNNPATHLVAHVHCPGTSSNGTDIYVETGGVGLDALGHEYTHCVQFCYKNLVGQPPVDHEIRPLEESFSDTFGEFIDQIYDFCDVGTDADWLIREDTAQGARRSMKDPTIFDHPDRRHSPLWYDGPYVYYLAHNNAGVGNKLAYLLTEGGFLNGYSVEAMGMRLGEDMGTIDLYYECLEYLGSRGDPEEVIWPEYRDLADGLLIAAGLLGMTQEQIDNIEQACKAVEISAISGDPLVCDQWNLYRIMTDRAWEINPGSEDVIVAVLDSTGINWSHPDLAAHIWINPGEDHPPLGEIGPEDFDEVDDDENGYVDDIRGWDFDDDDNDPKTYPGEPDYGDSHGTAAAGIVGAVANNGIGIAGVAKNVKIIPLKAGGTGSVLADMMEAMEYAVDNGARVVNCSWGPPKSQWQNNGLLSRLDDLLARGEAVFVCAAGNGNADIDSVPDQPYPVCHSSDNVVGVLATDHTDGIWDYPHAGMPGSNYGAVSVDLGAPGVDVEGLSYDDGYVFETGTSFAAPHVSAASALLFAEYAQWSPSDVRERLISSVDELDDLSGKCVSEGRLNMYRALGGCTTCKGDLNKDEWISTTDLGILTGLLTQAGPPYMIPPSSPLWNGCADLNDDEWITTVDLGILQGWLQQAGPPYYIPCPCPYE